MDNTKVITLNKALKNTSYKLCGFKSETNLDLKKLYNVGLTDETVIVPLYDSMVIGAVAYLIKGSVLGIRNKDAADIFVKKIL